MIKATVIAQLEDGDGNIYKVGDKVRIKMKSEIPDRANEYLGFVGNIYDTFFVLDCRYMTYHIDIDKIDKIRHARDEETFDNTWNFDD